MLNASTPRKSGNEPVVLLDQIEEGRFEYRTLYDEGTARGRWQSDWDDPSVTPVMVRVAIRACSRRRA